MMNIKLYQVDAFTDHVFGGNPAAICPLESWLPDDILQKIAMENNLSETAYFVRREGFYEIRWFTPELEIDLCGHATLASAHVIFNYLGYVDPTIRFKYKGGWLNVSNKVPMLTLDFPAIIGKPVDVTDTLISALGKKPIEAFAARDILILLESEEDVAGLNPDFTSLIKMDWIGIIVTARSTEVDFVSRFFAPKAGINEDPVTGSAHCMLIPYWAARTGKNSMEALQISKRKGRLSCTLNGDRVSISGMAVTYMIGEIFI